MYTGCTSLSMVNGNILSGTNGCESATWTTCNVHNGKPLFPDICEVVTLVLWSMVMQKFLLSCLGLRDRENVDLRL